MKRGIMALEELEDVRVEIPVEEVREEVPPVSDEELDAEVIDADAEASEIEADSAQIEEAESISDVLDVYEEQLGGRREEVAPEGDAGRAEAPVEGADPAAAAPAEGGDAGRTETPTEGREEAPTGEVPAGDVPTDGVDPAAGGADEAAAAAAAAAAGGEVAPEANTEAPAEGGEAPTEGRDEVPAEVVEAEREEVPPASEETLKAIEVAVEHFRQRLGYPKRVFPSLEHFDTQPEKTRERALKNVQIVNKALKKNLEVAQEGLIARAINAVERAFANYDKLEVKLNAIVKKIEASGTKEVDFKDAAWGRIFAATGKHDVGASDIAAMLDKFSNEYSKKVIPLVEKTAHVFSQIGEKIDSRWLVANSKHAEEISGMRNEVGEITNQLSESYAPRAMRKAEVDVKPLSKEEAVELAKKALAVIANSSARKAIVDFQKQRQRLNAVLGQKTSTRLMGSQSADFRATYKVISHGLGYTNALINDYIKAEFQLVYGVYKYLAAAAN